MESLHNVSFHASYLPFSSSPLLRIIFHKFGYIHLLLSLSLLMIFPLTELSIFLSHFLLRILFILFSVISLCPFHCVTTSHTEPILALLWYHSTWLLFCLLCKYFHSHMYFFLSPS